MPRIENAQRQFLLGSSFKGKQRKDGTSRKGGGSIRSSTQSETRSPPQTPSHPKIPSHGIIALSHSSTLEDLKKFCLDPRFTYTPRIRRHDPPVRHNERSSQCLR